MLSPMVRRGAGWLDYALFVTFFPHLIAGPDALAATLAATIEPGDMVVCLGAGDITKWAAGLADAIAAERAKVLA